MSYRPMRNEVLPYGQRMPIEGGELERRLKARQPLIFVETTDYELLDALLEKIRRNKKTGLGNIYEFVPGVGSVSFSSKLLAFSDGEDSAKRQADSKSLYHFFFEHEEYSDGDLLIVRGGTRFFETTPESVDWIRMIVGNDLNDCGLVEKELGEVSSGRFLFVLIVGAMIHIPTALIPYSTRIVLPKPNLKDIERIFWEELSAIEKRLDMKTPFRLGVSEHEASDERQRKELRQAVVRQMSERLKGFNESEIRMLIRYAFQSDNFARSKEYILDAKKEMVARTGFLRLADVSDVAVNAARAKNGMENQDAVPFGGLDELRAYLEHVAKLASLPDSKLKPLDGYGTKGILLVGMPGCGKSLAAKAAGTILNRPIIQLDVGKLLGKYVGESEANMRMALEIADRAAPCVLWIDELEKAFSGLDSSDGTALRLFGAFLTWLQEKKTQVYVIATANNVEKIPDEFKRKGRFDEIFSILLPSREERSQIFRHHLARLLKVEVPDSALQALCDRMAKRADYVLEDGVDDKNSTEDNEARGFSGADITAIVYSAYGEVVLDSDAVTLTGLEKALAAKIDEMKRNRTTQRKIMAARRVVAEDGKTMDGYRWAYRKLTSGGYRPASK